MARRISSDDGDRGADDIDVTIRVQGAGMVVRVCVPDDDGTRHFLRLLPHVQGS